MPKFDEKKNSKGASKPNYYSGNLGRKDEEKQEGLETVSNNTAPETKFQTNQQVSDVDGSTKVDAPATGFTKKTTSAGGSAVKQEVASKLLLTDADYAGVAGGTTTSAKRSGLVSLSYSGDAGTILGSAANTPYVGEAQRRNDRRFDKKMDAAMKKINFLASEQVLTEYQNPAPLGTSANEVQGYYGTPKNASVRSQKSAGGTPADMLVERSADELSEDMLFYKDGQYVRGAFDGYEDIYGLEPTHVTTFNDSGVRQSTELTGDNAIRYSNYLPREMKVTIARDSQHDVAYIKSIDYTVANAAVTAEDLNVLNSASTALIRAMNRAEIARQNIDSKAGRETEENWSALGRAINQPTQYVGLLEQIENDTGCEIYTAYKFASKAHSYQLNKTAKDGQRVETPAKEMMLGTIVSNISSKDYTNGDYFNGYSSVFDRKAMREGAASLMIALNDSTSKYEKKADFLLQPKSLRHVFQIADNSMDVFRCNPEFVAALNNEDVFSTIDRDYDPLLPVCLTDRVGLFSTLDWNRFGAYDLASGSKVLKPKYTPVTYAYANRSSNYVTNVEHPLLAGIKDYLVSKANKLYRTLADDLTKNDDVILSVPIVHSTTAFALWDFLVLASVPYVVKRRINSMRDVLDFETNFEYPFALKPIAELNPRNAVNYTFTDIDSPLQSKRMIPSAAVRWLMPEFMWGAGKDTTGSKDSVYVLPWYFNEMQFVTDFSKANENATIGYSMEYMNGVMSMPVIRNGIRLGYLDDLYSMSERDIRLSLDRMVCPPIGTNSSELAFNVYKYGQANEGIPCIKGSPTVLQVLSTPRELGYFCHAPHGLLRVRDNLSAAKGHQYKWGFAAFLTDLDEKHPGDTSYRLRCWKGVEEVPNEILQASSVNIARAQAFRQYWDCTPACLMSEINGTSIISGYRRRPNVGFLVAMRQCFEGDLDSQEVKLALNQGYFIPFTVGSAPNSNSAQAQSANSNLGVIALHKGLWGRLQRLPMVISPFDTCDFRSTDSNGANYDPFDFAYMFGLAGFMASDYNQDLYNRTNHVQDQGWLYITDDFVKDSPVIKDGVRYTIQ